MNGELELIATSEGKAVPNMERTFEYVYNLKDHLGNVRVSFKDDGNGDATIIQQDHYYPFGMRLAGLSTASGDESKYLYNSKELQDDHNLYWYHYGALYYDPQLGRWHTVDPVDEFHSPYLYCSNNPIMFIDPDGSTTVLHDDGTFEYVFDGAGFDIGAYADDYYSSTDVTFPMEYITYEYLNRILDEYGPINYEVVREGLSNIIGPGFIDLAQSADIYGINENDTPILEKTHYIVRGMNKWFRSDEINYIGIGSLYRANPIMNKVNMVGNIFAWKAGKPLFSGYPEFFPTSGTLYWANYGYNYNPKPLTPNLLGK